MKTQFIVTVTQTGEDPETPHWLADRMRDVLRDKMAPTASSVTVRHVVEETDPAADTLEALVREYGNSPVAGKGRVRADVLADIRAMIPNDSTQVATNSSKPSLPVIDVVASLNKTSDDAKATMVVSVRDVRNVLADAHRAGQATGRLLPKEGRERAMAFAEQALAVLIHV